MESFNNGSDDYDVAISDDVQRGSDDLDVLINNEAQSGSDDLIEERISGNADYSRDNTLIDCSAETAPIDYSGLSWARKYNENGTERQKGIATLDKHLPVLSVDAGKLKNPPAGKIQVTWIGHATVYVQFDGISVLTDPVFGEWCGSWIAKKLHLAYKRYRRVPCGIRDLPTVDAVLISHNHYDHLEESAVREISTVFNNAQWFVTLEQKQFLVDNGVEDTKIVELDWWEESNLKINEKAFSFICTPSQHWCQRWLFDMNKVLWCSWVIKGPTKSFYFSGDTGYFEKLFKEIGKKYGPFDLAAIPIGAYEPRFITKFQHVDPEEAVKIHKDIGSKQSIGIHWGTFELTNEFYAEPPQKVEEEMKKLELDPKLFVSLCHGETWCVGDDREPAPFMNAKPPASQSRSSAITESKEEGTHEENKHLLQTETSANQDKVTEENS